MARPREFDTATALRGAMDVFWQHGYEQASLPLLLDGMGLTRGSLYKAFTDKKSLFLEALKQYEATAVIPALALLEDETIADGLQRIETLLNGIIDAVRRGDRRGCMLCSAAAGPAAEDPEIASAVDRLMSQMRTGFVTALAQSRLHAKTPEAQTELASMLATHYVGLRILARSQAPVAALEDSVSALMALLRSLQTT